MAEAVKAVIITDRIGEVYVLNDTFSGHASAGHPRAHHSEIGGVRLWAPLQSPHMGQGALAGSLDLEPEKIRVTVPTVGGGFGARIATYPEQVALAAIALGTLLAAIAGGKAGTHYHRKIDRAGAR